MGGKFNETLLVHGYFFKFQEASRCVKIYELDLFENQRENITASSHSHQALVSWESGGFRVWGGMRAILRRDGKHYGIGIKGSLADDKIDSKEP